MEIEAKFSVPDEQAFRQLLEATALAGHRLGEALVANLHDRYLDTAQGAIRARGYACRLRRRDDVYIATLKGMGGASGAVHRRVEHEIELAEPLPPHAWPPSAARDLALRLCENQALTVLFDVDQVRHTRPLYDGDRAVAKLNLDRVRVGRGDFEAATSLELEVELLPDGREEDLHALVVALQEGWGLTPETRSKFERGLDLFGLDVADAVRSGGGAERLSVATEGGGSSPGTVARMTPIEEPLPPAPQVELLEQPGIEPDDPMSEAGRKTFRFHYRRMIYNEPGTRLGEDIEALHDMRVATRRMRAAFRVFGDHFHPKAVAPYLKGLKRTGRALGAVRDLDVFREEIQAYLRTLPEPERGNLDDLLAALEEQREAARQRMIAFLDEDRYRRFVERFGEFVVTEGMGSLPVTPDGGDPRPYRVRHVAPMAIYERLATVRAYDEWVSIPDPPLQRLHALRIACKRLRYTLEFFREVLGPDTKTLIKEVVDMQDHLGALQDAVVAGGILRDFLEWGTWGHDAADQPLSEPKARSAPGVEAYLLVKQAELQHLLDTFGPAWQRLRGPEFSRLVAKAVVVL